MNPEREKFLNLRHLPARLTLEEAAWVLGMSPHEMPVVVAAGLLRPLGHPAVNGSKYFAKKLLIELAEDPKWLARCSDTITEHWRLKNGRKSEQYHNCHEPANLAAICNSKTHQNLIT